MSGPVEVTAALGLRLEQNDILITADYARTRARLFPGCSARVEPLESGLLCFTAPAFPTNRAVGLGLSGPMTDATLEAAEAFFRAVGEPASVGSSPFVAAGSEELLRRRGYACVRTLDVHLRELNGLAPAPAPGVRVTRVSPAERELWAMTVAQGFSGGEEVPADDLGLAIARIAAARECVTCFLGWLEGQPAGAGALAVLDGVATLFSTSTRAAYRQRGVHTALIQARLAAAAQAGADVALVLASPGSASAASVQRKGFRRAYTRQVFNRDLTPR
jgi:GNAT superfamily N-acetyltransferase